MNIKTHYDPKPIPDRRFDWSAIDDDTYDGAEDSGPLARAVGYGKTEQEAIDDLRTQIDDCEECRGHGETVHRGYGGDPVNDYVRTCSACKGSGRVSP